ncbi:GNAT family N-acetyltransferase [Ornithinibacillus halophilus]|uniref:L-amino acid N-acyltransferase YncA n=1 Tax=Ornithinibacillus halophilus TaxID=930117 RepID=A0A1M5JAA7_9BACI|nr:GNAT family N-acetyltransferase [Ornithinibacillus halophilus]SHG37315.1 L-amino acid N-acyltransferase YncA [Ornithinibacillus halophilus]
MNIRRAVPEDASGVAKVQVDSWKTTYKNIVPDEYLNKMTYESREQKWKEIISEKTVYVAETDDGEIIGFSNGGKERTGKYPNYNGELYAIYILESYQRKGLGKLLLEPIIKELKQKGIYSMTVLVLEENGSRFFYESLGAKKIDTVEIDILGKKLHELVYGWEDIRTIV